VLSGVVRGGAIVFLVASTSARYAPYQCGHSPERSLREETPGEALYGVAQKLKAEGDQRGYETTLRYLIERYPSSRFAAMAEDELGVDGAAP
jgi:outer membrane protein assembly factor BamD (BamD/ComL family)